MTWRGLVLPLVCVAAFAQLPRSQAPMPREGSHTPGRLDASVTDFEGRPIVDLKAADFTLEAGGKPEKIESCTVEKDQPLRLAILIDDLSLPVERLNAARRTLRQFIATGIRDSDEIAILRAGAGSGGLDGFTSDKAALEKAIDRAHYNPTSEESTPQSFAAGALNAMRSALEGMREIPGRKALLLISERLSVNGRGNAESRDDRLAQPAHRAATVLYAFDASPAAAPALEQGLSAWVKETGGRTFDSGDLAAALARIAQEQRTYYVLTFGGDDLGFDFFARAPKVGQVALRTARQNVVVRARSGYFGGLDDTPGADLGESDREFAAAGDADRLSGGIRAKLTAVLTLMDTWQVEAAVHVEARDLTFVKGADRIYRTRIDTATVLLDDRGKSVRDAARSFQAQLSAESWARFQKHGLNYTLVLPVAREGSYMLYSAVRDGASGRIGSTRQFVRVTDVKDAKLAMSSLMLRGEVEKSADGAETPKDPLESVAIRSFRSGHRISYAYNVFNVAADSGKRSEIESHSEIWRDGVRIYNAQPQSIAFPASDSAVRRSVSGTIAMDQSMAPGAYILRITVTDKLTKRSASQWTDFEVRP